MNKSDLLDGPAVVEVLGVLADAGLERLVEGHARRVHGLGAVHAVQVHGGLPQPRVVVVGQRVVRGQRAADGRQARQRLAEQLRVIRLMGTAVIQLRWKSSLLVFNVLYIF